MAQNLDVHKHALVSLSDDPNYPAGTQGDEYTVRDAGHIGGASGPYLTVGARILCVTDSVGGTYAAVGANWRVEGASQSKVITATATLTAAECTGGAKIGLNHATVSIVATLPAAFVGMDVWFFNIIASSASHTVVTAASANVFAGGFVNRAGDAGDGDDDGDTISFVGSAAVRGDSAHLTCLDGTNILVNGYCDVATGGTITKAS